MKIFQKLYPIKLYLSIFQLEGYDISRFAKWIFNNFFVRSIPEKRRLVLTPKTKLLLLVSFFTVFLTLYFTSFIFTLLIATQFYLFLIIAQLILFPAEKLIIFLKIIKTKNKIMSLKNLKVVAVTGSYGKTSVKELLYQLIGDKLKVLRTPESYNTVLGISKVVDYELDDTYQYFICEMAAYKKGDIKNLCRMLRPEYGIITGVTRQHLERFKTLENIIKTKFELVDSIKNKGEIIFNLNDKNVLGEIEKRGIKKPKGYLKVKDFSFSREGSKFTLLRGSRKYCIKTNLFGISSVINLAGAATAALELGVDITEIIKRSRNLLPVENRMALRKFGSSMIVDNTFSGNEKSLRQSIQVAGMIEGRKVLVTPGIVELGKKEELINQQMGKRTRRVFGKVILVGRNKRTASFAKYIQNNSEYINDNKEDYFNKLEQLKNQYDWIFLENDVTQNY